MVLKVLRFFGQKPDKQVFRQRIRVMARIFALISLSLLLLATCYHGDDFGRGFLVGLSLALGGCSLAYWRLLRDDKGFKDHYIKVFDERYQTIQGLSAVTTLITLTVSQIVLIILATFWQVFFTYQVLLFGSFFFLVGVFLLAKWFWSKMV